VQSVFEAAGGHGGLLRLAEAWHYFACATTTTMSAYVAADNVPQGLSIPRWSWDGLCVGR
jgi:hypothetical protein